MATTQPLDLRILSQLIPREYNGKSAQEGRRFLAHTRLYLDQIDRVQNGPPWGLGTTVPQIWTPKSAGTPEV